MKYSEMLSTVSLFFTFLYHWHCVSLLLLLLLWCFVQTMANILSFMRQLSIQRIPTESTDTAAGTVMVMAFLFSFSRASFTDIIYDGAA